MKEYELMTVIKPNMDTDEVSKVIAKLEEQINTLNGKVLNTDKIGRKKLSYDIQKFRDGFFVVHRFELNEDKVVELRRLLKLNDALLRNMLLTADKVTA